VGGMVPTHPLAHPCCSHAPLLTLRCSAAAGVLLPKKCMSGWVRTTSRSICSRTSWSWGGDGVGKMGAGRALVRLAILPWHIWEEQGPLARP
jgi:hypothetical protein